MKNKKAISEILGFITFFSFLLLLVIFATIMIKDIGKTEILDRIDNITYSVEGDLGLSTQMKEHIHSIPQTYDDIIVPYDLYFLLSIIVAFVLSIFSAYKAKEIGVFSFFGYITMGMIGVLFFTGFMNTINEWFILNFIEGFLEYNLESLPMINYYISNIGVINLIWGVIILLVNKLNFKFDNDVQDNTLIEGGGFER